MNEEARLHALGALRAAAEDDAARFGDTSEAPPMSIPEPVHVFDAAPAPEPPKFAEAQYDYQRPAMTIPLRHPFRIGGAHFAQIDVEEPRFDQAQALLEGKITRIELFALMTGVPVEALGALRWTDAERVFGVCSDLAP